MLRYRFIPNREKNNENISIVLKRNKSEERPSLKDEHSPKTRPHAMNKTMNMSNSSNVFIQVLC